MCNHCDPQTPSDAQIPYMEEEPGAVTILDLAEFILGHPARTSGDFAEAGLPMLDGWANVADAYLAVFPPCATRYAAGGVERWCAQSRGHAGPCGGNLRPWPLPQNPEEEEEEEDHGDAR